MWLASEDRSEQVTHPLYDPRSCSLLRVMLNIVTLARGGRVLTPFDHPIKSPTFSNLLLRPSLTPDHLITFDPVVGLTLKPPVLYRGVERNCFPIGAHDGLEVRPRYPRATQQQWQIETRQALAATSEADDCHNSLVITTWRRANSTASCPMRAFPRWIESSNRSVPSAASSWIWRASCPR